MKKYTVNDAFTRVNNARIGSLSKDHITFEYLIKLRSQIYEWLEHIEKAIKVGDWPEDDKL